MITICVAGLWHVGSRRPAPDKEAGAAAVSAHAVNVRSGRRPPRNPPSLPHPSLFVPPVHGFAATAQDEPFAPGDSTYVSKGDWNQECRDPMADDTNKAKKVSWSADEPTYIYNDGVASVNEGPRLSFIPEDVTKYTAGFSNDVSNEASHHLK